MHKSKKKKQNTSSFLPKTAPLQKPAVHTAGFFKVEILEVQNIFL
jgi:hypothetical protein